MYKYKVITRTEFERRIRVVECISSFSAIIIALKYHPHSTVESCTLMLQGKEEPVNNVIFVDFLRKKRVA